MSISKLGLVLFTSRMKRFEDQVSEPNYQNSAKSILDETYDVQKFLKKKKKLSFMIAAKAFDLDYTFVQDAIRLTTTKFNPHRYLNTGEMLLLEVIWSLCLTR